MKLKRLPLFIFGLIYGFIVQPVVCALIFLALTPVCSMGFMMKRFHITIRQMVLGGIIYIGILVGLTIGALLGITLAVPLLITIGGVCLIPFLYQFFCGLIKGLEYGWHCAMEFYDHGVVQGLSFPFRFANALFVRIICVAKYGDNNNRIVKKAVQEANAFHTTTEIASKKDAEEVIKTHIETVISTVNDNLSSHLPRVVSNIIIQYMLYEGQKEIEQQRDTFKEYNLSMSDDELDICDAAILLHHEAVFAPFQLTHPIPAEWIRHIARHIEASIGRSCGQETIAPKTTMDFLQPREAVAIMHRIFNQKLLKPERDNVNTDGNYTGHPSCCHDFVDALMAILKSSNTD